MFASKHQETSILARVWFGFMALVCIGSTIAFYVCLFYMIGKS